MGKKTIIEPGHDGISQHCPWLMWISAKWVGIHDGFPGEKFQEPTSSISSRRDEHEPEEEAGKSAKAHSQ